MHISRFLGSVAVLAAPLSIATAQSSAAPDSSSGNQTATWLAATSAAAGAGLFLAFTRAGGSSQNSFIPQSSDPNPSTPIQRATQPTTPPATPPAGPTGGVTPPPASPPPVVVTPPDAAPPDQPPPVVAPPNQPPPPVETTTHNSTPSYTGAVTPPPQDAPPPPALKNTESLFQPTAPLGPTDDPPATPPGNPFPHENALAVFEHHSTVPEPSSLALTATGIIGLIPLIRRRR